MNHPDASERYTTRSHRLVRLLGYLLILVFALRRPNDLVGEAGLALVLTLVGLFTGLYSAEPWLTRRFPASTRAYFIVQMALVQGLGLFKDYQDTWAILYVILGFQVAWRCSRKDANLWWSLFTASTVVSLLIEFGPISGLGRALAYFVIGVFLISYDIQYAQHEDTLAESQVLLSELREAHKKLEDHAAQAEKLAAAQERNRMIQELHDSVGQKIFAIQLAAEATRLMLEQDPRRSAEQMVDLQAQTQAALGQMRQLIGQWRPD
jgi:signal transduction histidine kinase